MKTSAFLTLGDDSVAPSLRRGSGSPEGAITANPGSVYMDTSAGGIWEKGTGTGNTGWYQTDNVGGLMNAAGNWFWTPHTGVTTRAFSANECTYQAVYLSTTVTIDSLALQVTTAGVGGSPTIRLGIFSMASTGLPGTLIKDMGAVACTAIATISATTGQAAKCVPGWYFFACAAQGATTTQPTIRVMSQGYPNPNFNSGSTTASASSGAQQSFTATGISGAFASNPAVSLGAQNPPRFQFKVASVP